MSPPKKRGVQDELSSTCTSAMLRQPRSYVQVDPGAMWDMIEEVVNVVIFNAECNVVL